LQHLSSPHYFSRRPPLEPRDHGFNIFAQRRKHQVHMSHLNCRRKDTVPLLVNDTTKDGGYDVALQLIQLDRIAAQSRAAI
jgi:hypothetical protein